MLKKVIIVFFILGFSNWSINILAQTNIESLILNLETSEIDSVVNKTLLDLCWALKSSEPEQAMDYGQKALTMAREKDFEEYEALALKNIGIIHLFQSNYEQAANYLQAALKIFSKLNNQKGLSSCYNNLGLVMEQRGDFEIASANYQKSLSINEKIKNSSGVASSLTNIGNILQKQGNYSSSIETYMRVLKIREELNDKIGIADALNNIGALYEKQNAYNEAIKNYQKALALYIGINEKPKSAMVLNNIGFILSEQKKYSEALDYFKHSLDIRLEFGDKQGIGLTYLNMGNVFKKQKMFKNAFDYYNKCYFIFKEIGNKYGIITVQIALSDYYININEYSRSINQIEDLLKNEHIMPGDLSQAYHILSIAYEKTNNYRQAYQNQKLYRALKDSLENEENVKKILQIQLKYEYNKKEKELEIIREKQRLNDLVSLNNRKLIIFILIIFLIAFLLIGLFIYRGYRIKKQDNLILELQKKEIEEKNVNLQLFQEELISQNENLEIQKKIVIGHRDKISEQNQKITDSIQYAKRIQDTMLPPEEVFVESFHDYFLLFKPKDIVSGDFYWIKETENQIYLAVADCTGHGVPGAFMSLLGISFLNEIVESGLTTSSSILSEVRKRIKVALRYQINKQESKEGMDIALCVVNKSTREIQFSGAYHSLLILKDTGNEESELLEIKGDKMPVGAHFHEDKKFSEHNIKYDKNDRFYLFTDGFVDQFGGVSDRKFLPGRFKEIISRTGRQPMRIQKKELVDSLEKWMDKNEQVDDILVIGFTLNNQY